MKTTRSPLMHAASLAAALALGGCGQSSQPASVVPSTPPPTASTVPPAPLTPSPFPPPASSAGVASPVGDDAATVTLGSLEIGSSVDAEHRIVAAGTSFAPQDTVYASVETTGSGHATLTAKWLDKDGQTVHEDSKVLDVTGPETTTFMISRPSGFPEGDYRVQISLDGRPLASKNFAIRK